MQKRHTLTRWLVRAGVLILVVCLYAVAGFLGAPLLIDSQARKFVQATYGRELSIGKIRVNPFTLSVDVEKFAMPDADGGPLLGFDHLLINLDVNSIWRRALSFHAIALDGLAVNAVVRPGGAFNLADLQAIADGNAATEPVAPGKANAPLPRIVIDDLQLNNGQIHFEDRNRSRPFITTVSPLTFRLSNFSTFADGERYTLNARVFDTGQLAWRGSLTAQPLASQGEFSLSNIPLPRLAAFLGDALPVTLTSGLASLRGDYRLTADDFMVVDGEGSIATLAVRPRGVEVDYISLDKVVASGLKLSVAAQKAEIGELAVDGGRVQAWLSPEGNLNLSALAGPPSDSDATPAAKSWQVGVPSLKLDRLAVSIEDRSLNPAAVLDLQPLQITVKGFSTKPGTSVDVQAIATINGTGRATVSARSDLESLSTTADFELSDLNLAMLQPYIAQQTSMTLTEGALAAKGRVTYADAQPAAKIVFDGDVAITDLRTIDNALREDFVKWAQLGVRGIHYQSAPQGLRIRTIDVRSPYARVIIAPDGTTNIAAILAGSDAPTTSAPATSAPAAAAPKDGALPFPTRIGTVSITNGSARFADFTTKPNFDIGLEKLKGTIAGLSSDPGSRATVEVDGQVDEFSPVTIRGDVNPLAAETFLDMSMTLGNVELASFTPYSGRFAGYSIRQGKLSADLNYKIKDRRLDADHKFVINQLQLGDKVESPDATSLPLKLAVALLKDQNGVIDLDLPVTGDIDDPRFRIGPIVWKVFVNLIKKAVTAPFALLGKLVGGGEEINLIEFPAGDATLDSGNVERIASLVKAMTERPGLSLNVPATYNHAADVPVLTEAAFEQKLIRFREAQLAARKKPVTELNYAAVTNDPETYRKLLEDVYLDEHGQKFSPPEPAAGNVGQNSDDTQTTMISALESALRSRINVDDATLFALARSRALAVQERLLTDTGIDPGRVFLTAPVEGKADQSGVILELGLR
ncbi:MAG: DUF748 domain-containing protein [Gammaproteobacteria bacterium]